MTHNLAKFNKPHTEPIPVGDSCILYFKYPMFAKNSILKSRKIVQKGLLIAWDYPRAALTCVLIAYMGFCGIAVVFWKECLATANPTLRTSYAFSSRILYFL